MEEKLKLLNRKRIQEKRLDEIIGNVKQTTLDDDPINYLLERMNTCYEAGITYNFSFPYLKDGMEFICLWGFVPLYIGDKIYFDKVINIEKLATYVNLRHIKETFKFFSNITCLLHLEEDQMQKLNFFEKGKKGFIYNNEKEYLLLISIDSLNYFDNMSRTDDYNQFMLIKIVDEEILRHLELESLNEDFKQAEEKYLKEKEYNEQLKYDFSEERKEYINKINKLKREKDEEIYRLKSENEKNMKEKNDEINSFREALINKPKRIKKFLGLKISSDSFNVIKGEGKEDSHSSSSEIKSVESKTPVKKSNKANSGNSACIICFSNNRNILFNKCGHVCLCEECLSKFMREEGETFEENKYFCPICNNDKSKKRGYTTARKILF